MCTRKAFDALLVGGGKELKGSMYGIYQFMTAFYQGTLKKDKPLKRKIK